jgi:hypothetical protein
MGTTSSFFGGGGGAFLPHFILTTGFTASGTWTADLTGQICVHVIGAGGAGAMSNDGTGGAAGGYCRKIFDVSSGDSFTFTQGAGGKTSNAAGNSSTFSNSSTINLVANGGSGGTNSTNTRPNGGSATGGDVNVTGGKAGLRNLGNQRTGGGAVGIFGVDGGNGFQSGDVTSTGGAHYCTGGAGIGGASASLFGTSTGSYGHTSGGGGSGGPSVSVTDDGWRGQDVDQLARGGPASITKPENCKNLFRFIPEFGVGGSAQTMRTSQSHSFSSEPPGIGGGGAATCFRGYSYFAGQDGGMFAGGGAGGDSKCGGNGGWGGGGGAGYANTQVRDPYTTVQKSGGLGGDGVIFVEYLSA